MLDVSLTLNKIEELYQENRYDREAFERDARTVFFDAAVELQS